MIVNLNSDGGAWLNFKVVGGTTQPSNPKENTIWVNTSAEITSWQLGDYPNPGWEEPEGKVLINAEASANANSPTFNALKKNGLRVRPLSFYQRISGVWVRKAGAIYQNGQWNNLFTWLYQDGTNFTNITGGWKTAGVSANDNWTAKVPSIAYNPTNITLTLSENGHLVSGIVYTANKIDLTNVSKIYFNGSSGGVDDYMRSLAVFSAATYEGRVAAVGGIVNGSALDVSSLSGSYYVGFYLGAGGAYNAGEITCTITCERLYML